jgi:drug/metabolite transporter superfamily protein YnfA
MVLNWIVDIQFNVTYKIYWAYVVPQYYISSYVVPYWYIPNKQYGTIYAQYTGIFIINNVAQCMPNILVCS